MEKFYHFIWPEDFHEKLEDVYVSMLYSFKEETFTQIETMYRDWLKKMALIIEGKVADGTITPIIGLERRQELVKLLNSASVVANLAVGTSSAMKLNLFYSEFERFINSVDLRQPLAKAPHYGELASAISVLGQIAFLGALGSAILAKNTEERDYKELVKDLQRPYLKAIARQYVDEIAVVSEKFSVYETAVNAFNEHRFDTIRERLMHVYDQFGLADYVIGSNDITAPAFRIVHDHAEMPSPASAADGRMPVDLDTSPLDEVKGLDPDIKIEDE